MQQGSHNEFRKLPRTFLHISLVLSMVCLFQIWTFKLSFLLNARLQCWHVNIFTPVCTGKCLFNLFFDIKTLSHNRQGCINLFKESWFSSYSPGWSVCVVGMSEIRKSIRISHSSYSSSYVYSLQWLTICQLSEILENVCCSKMKNDEVNFSC